MSVTDTIKEMFSNEATGSVNSLHALFVDTLRDIYHGEKQILKALPKMARHAYSADLRAAFEKHRQETEGQVDRLEQVFDLLDLSARGKTCEAIQGLVAEGHEVIESAENEVRDAGLVAAAQAVEHYEIARYGTLVAWAKEMGHTQVAKLLEQNLKEEQKTDESLNKLALGGLNRLAAEVITQDGESTRLPSGKMADASNNRTSSRTHH